MRHLVEKLHTELDWRLLQEFADWTLEQALAIQHIPAPTFHERPRAEYVAQTFTEIGLQEIAIDSLHNVCGRLPGKDSDLSPVILSAHMDTIFAADTDLTVKREGDCIFAPGLGDNSIGVAGLMAIPYALQQMSILPERDLRLIATTREEGLGDLGGMRAAFQSMKGNIHCVINVEGLAFGHVYHAGIAVRRLHISASAPGGHSWLHFGRSSAVHAIVQLGAKLTSIQPPQTPRTTYNIGMIEGGEAINAIATSASLWFDMRSEDRATLEAFETQVRRYVAALSTDDLMFTVRIVGDRPAGQLSPEHPLVQCALAALTQVGAHGTLETGSTDANVPLSEGCPAVTVGVTRGGNAHRLDEYVETQPVASGLQQLILLTLAASAREEIG